MNLKAMQSNWETTDGRVIADRTRIVHANVKRLGKMLIVRSGSISFSDAHV